MWIDFEKLSQDARVWVYQANRPLTNLEVETINQALKPALSQWSAHGQPLLASAQVIENRFVVVGVDEGYNLPSGCSIDASVRTLREIGQQLSRPNAAVDFFDRSAAVQTADGSVMVYPLPLIKTAVNAGLITADTLVYNTLVATKAEFMTGWHIRAADSWLKRYFKSVTA